MSSSHPAPWFIPRLIRDRQRTFGAVVLRMPALRPSSLLTRSSPPRRLAVVGLLAGLFVGHLALAPSPVAASLAPEADAVVIPRFVSLQFAPLEPPPSRVSTTMLLPVPPQVPPLAPPPPEASPAIPRRTAPRHPPLVMPPMTTPDPPLVRLEDLGLLPVPTRRVPSLPDRGSHG